MRQNHRTLTKSGDKFVQIYKPTMILIVMHLVEFLWKHIQSNTWVDVKETTTSKTRNSKSKRTDANEQQADTQYSKYTYTPLK